MELAVEGARREREQIKKATVGQANGEADTLALQAGRLINPTRVKYFSRGNRSADFSETRGIDWTLLGASNEGTAHSRFGREHTKLKKSRTF